MRILATFRIAGRALRRNLMRTILTLLGMIIGVGAVIAGVSIGNGAKAQVEAQIASLGQNVIQIISGSISRGGVRSGFGGAGTLMVDDAAALHEIEGITVVSPEARSSAQVTSPNGNWSTSIQGEGEGYLDLRVWALTQGAMFTEQDVRGASKVAVVGKTVADQLYPDGDVLGQVIRIRNVPFVIVGELAVKGTSFSGQDQDDVVLVPYTSSMKRLSGATTLRNINVQAADPKRMAEVQQEIINVLRQRHRIQADREDDFFVRNQQEIADVATANSKVMTWLLGAIASVSLLVGGIGIMNIMLVSVTERTREIGIRMAVGAHGRDILLQFLIEAVTLSVIGGAMGIGLGILSSKIISDQMKWPTLTPMVWIALAFLVSAVVGIVAGFYPAWKASKLDPIDALRYE